MRMVIDIGVSTVASDMEEEGKSDVGGGNREEAETSRKRSDERYDQHENIRRFPGSWR